MTRFVLWRLAAILPMVWIVATLTFVVMHAAPGTYADQFDYDRHGSEAREKICERYGLDQPLHVQYLRWLGALARGDLGSSFHFKKPVSALLAQALPPTLLLAGLALALDLLLAVALSVGAARRPGGWFDRLITVGSLGLYGIPSFWFAGLLILVFCLGLGWFPSSHMHSVGADGLAPWARILDLIHHLILPAGCLGILGAAATARYLRAAMLDVAGSRYILAARARGVSERRILWIHTLKPALLPVVTIIGLSLPFLVSGSVVVEAVFSWPGMGSLLIGAAHARDLPVIMAVSMVGAVAVMLGNLVADLLYAVVDPRARIRE